MKTYPPAIGHRGTRWLSPCFLELCEGPWGRGEDFQHNVVKSWRAAIDWHAENGLDTIIGDIALSRSDAVYLGWGFHYLLDFEGYPYAEELFSRDFRNRRADELNAIFSHAEERGIRCFAQHFNFLAPRRMAFARGWVPRYESNANMGGRAPDRLGLLVQNCRWSNADYQEFMFYCWRETLKLLPALSGILATFGEPTYGLFTLNPDGTTTEGKSPGAENDFPSRYYADERFAANAVDFAEKFSAEIKAAGRTPMMRAWGVQWAMHRMPKVADYVVKYQLFDCIDAPPDPLVAKWVEAGHRVWVEAEIVGENAGPILWTAPKYFERVAHEAARLGIVGFVTHVNTVFEPASLNSAAKYINLELMVAALQGEAAPALRERAVAILQKDHEEDAASLCEALELIGGAILSFSRVIHRSGEGFTFGWAYGLLPVSTGSCSIIMASGAPPPWCRQGLAAFKEYLDYLALHEYSRGWLEDCRGDRECPLRLMRRVAEEARGAEEILNEMAARKPDNQGVADLALCAALAGTQAIEIAATLEAVLAYYAAKSCVDMDLQKENAAECLERFHESHVARARLREISIQLSAAHFASANTQYELVTRLCASYERHCVESAFYEKECEELLAGKIWTMSAVEVNWRGLDALGPIQVPWRLLEQANHPRLDL